MKIILLITFYALLLTSCNITTDTKEKESSEMLEVLDTCKIDSILKTNQFPYDSKDTIQIIYGFPRYEIDSQLAPTCCRGLCQTFSH